MSGMFHGSKGRVNTALACSANLETKIDIRMRNRSVYFIKPPNLEKNFASHRQAGAGQDGDVAHRLREIGMHGGAGILLMEGGTRKIANARDETGVLNSPGVVKQFWRDRSNIGIFK